MVGVRGWTWVPASLLGSAALFVGDNGLGQILHVGLSQKLTRVLDSSYSYLIGCKFICMFLIILGKRVWKPVPGTLMSR